MIGLVWQKWMKVREWKEKPRSYSNAPMGAWQLHFKGLAINSPSFSLYSEASQTPASNSFMSIWCSCMRISASARELMASRLALKLPVNSSERIKIYTYICRSIRVSSKVRFFGTHEMCPLALSTLSETDEGFGACFVGVEDDWEGGGLWDSGGSFSLSQSCHGGLPPSS